MAPHVECPLGGIDCERNLKPVDVRGTRRAQAPTRNVLVGKLRRST